MFYPQQYISLSSRVTSITLGEDGDTVTVKMQQFDPMTGQPTPDAVFCYSKAGLQSGVENISAFLAAITL